MKKLVDDLTAEWVTKDGSVTCEFSIGVNQLFDVLDYLAQVSDEKLSEFGAMWYVRQCSTCRGHDSSKPYHCEIIRAGSKAVIKKAEHLLRACLEWNNLGERDYDYEEIVTFLNDPLTRKFL